MQPDEVLDAAGLDAAGTSRQDRVHVVAGDCAAVECVDIYLESAGPLSPRVARPLAVVAVVALLAVGAWNLALQSQLDQRDRTLRAVAAAVSGGEAAFRVEGSAGRGYVVETPGRGAALVIGDLTTPPAGRIYELWLLDTAGTPVAVATFSPGRDAIAVVAMDRDLTGFATFAVTVEAQRVEAPTGDPVMIGQLN